MDDKKQLRSFGFIWAFIFLGIALYPLLKEAPLRLWSLYIAIGFTVISITFPLFYQKIYFYQGWIKFGNVVGNINSKIIIFILFYVIFLPMGILLKIFRKDLLKKRIDKSAKSYFLDRKDQPKEMQNQF